MTTKDTTPPGKYPLFAAALRADMDEKRRSVADVARYINTSTNAVRKYLAGENLPGPQKLVDLAQFMGAPVDRYLQDSPFAAAGSRTRTPAARMVFMRGGPVGEPLADYLPRTPDVVPADADPVAGALLARRTEFARDISEMLARYDNIDDLRAAYLTVAQTLGAHWETTRAARAG